MINPLYVKDSEIITIFFENIKKYFRKIFLFCPISVPHLLLNITTSSPSTTNIDFAIGGDENYAGNVCYKAEQFQGIIQSKSFNRLERYIRLWFVIEGLVYIDIPTTIRCIVIHVMFTK